MCNEGVILKVFNGFNKDMSDYRKDIFKIKSSVDDDQLLQKLGCLMVNIFIDIDQGIFKHFAYLCLVGHGKSTIKLILHLSIMLNGLFSAQLILIECVIKGKFT